MEIMKGHVKHGVDYLKSTEIAQPLIQAISEHHERLDGLGYPAGTKGEDISQAGRMLAIADMYDALHQTGCIRPVCLAKEHSLF